MSHTQHRLGSAEALRNEYIILPRTEPTVRAQLEYRGPLADRMAVMARILAAHHPVALDVRADGRQLRFLEGSPTNARVMDAEFVSLDEILRRPGVTQVRHAVYRCRHDVSAALRDIREADLGISIVLSSLLDDAFALCREGGLEPKTVSLSLGVWGRTGLLPSANALEICTMCGHGVVAHQLAETLAEAVSQGDIGLREAAFQISKQCVCNIVPMARAAAILERCARQADDVSLTASQPEVS